MFWTQYGVVPIAEAFHFRSRQPTVGGIDCIELFGGSGTTILILAKHHNMTTGLNFEMLCGVDLQQAPDVTYLFAYIERNKPKVAILAPPCVTSIVRSILKHGSVAVPQVLLWAS